MMMNFTYLLIDIQKGIGNDCFKFNKNSIKHLSFVLDMIFLLQYIVILQQA